MDCMPEADQLKKKVKRNVSTAMAKPQQSPKCTQLDTCEVTPLKRFHNVFIGGLREQTRHGSVHFVSDSKECDCWVTIAVSILMNISSKAKPF